MTQSQVPAVFAVDSFALTYTDKKGAMHGISAEGACFKGGAALLALKDHALDSALTKACAGRYRPAADILAAAFPSIAKAGEKYTGQPLWANKAAFTTFADAVLAAQVKDSTKGFNAKQQAARMLCQAWIKATAPVVAPLETVEQVAG